MNLSNHHLIPPTEQLNYNGWYVHYDEGYRQPSFVHRTRAFSYNKDQPFAVGPPPIRANQSTPLHNPVSVRYTVGFHIYMDKLGGLAGGGKSILRIDMATATAQGSPQISCISTLPPLPFSPCVI